MYDIRRPEALAYQALIAQTRAAYRTEHVEKWDYRDLGGSGNLAHDILDRPWTSCVRVTMGELVGMYLG